MIELNNEEIKPGPRAIEIWQQVSKNLTNFTAEQIQTTHATFNEWVNAFPIFDSSGRLQFEKDSLKSSQYKQYADVGDLARALAGHTRAKENRRKEESLAWSVIESFPYYENRVVDELINNILTIIDDQKKNYSEASEKMETKPFYGPVAKASWCQGTKVLQTSLNDESENHVRLYRKIAFIHDFSRKTRHFGKTPGRDEHAHMRVNKWTLKEDDELVKSDRDNGVSIWSGTSGSTMDIMHAAKQTGISDAKQLTELAWCAFAFFHIMPTVNSGTHTFHEVMRGAQMIEPEITYDDKNTKLPGADPATVAKINDLAQK